MSATPVPTLPSPPTEVVEQVTEPSSAVQARLESIKATFTENLQQSKDALVALRDAVPEKVAAVGEAVKHSDAVVIATAALTEVSERITTHPTFTKVADSVKSHQATLVDSIEHLKQYTADAKASIPSHPVVQQAMEALDRASVALTGLKQTAAETGAKITDSLLESIAAARGRAADAVAQAKSQLSTLAADMIARAHDRAVAVARKAGELESKYHIQDKATALATKLNLQERYAAAESFVKAKNEEWQLVDRAKAAVDKAAALDDTWASGRGAALVTWGQDVAAKSLEYATGLLSEFQAAAGTTTEVKSTM